MHFCVYLETLFVSRLRVQRYAFFLNLQAFGRFFREKVLFFIVRSLFPSFWAPFSVFSCPFGLFLFRFLLLFCFFFCRFSAVSLPFLLFVYLLAFALALLRASFLLLFLFLISPFSHFHSFSFLFISFVYDCPLFCLRCGRELRSIGKLRCRAGIDAVCKKGAERVIPFLCPLRIFHQPGILLPVPRALGYHIYCQSSSLYFSQRLLQCHVPGSL